MNPLVKLRRDQAGAGAIEFAIAMPVLVAFIYGFFTLGMVYRANAGLQHALGEAARQATLWRPTQLTADQYDTQIRNTLAQRDFGLDGGRLSTAVDTSMFAAGYLTINLTYSRETDFLFIDGPTVQVVRSKRVYVATT